MKIEYVSTAFRDADGRLKIVAASEWDNGSFARIRTRLIRIDKWKNLL